MNPVVILPTYNERENLPVLVPEILAAIPAHVLIVDDHSPDGTGDLAEGLARTRPDVSVIHRPEKLGLGSAYVRGFRWALERDFDVIVQMDADRSHSPGDIPRLVRALSDCEVAIGSRYAAGGGIRDWPFSRRLISSAGNLYARSVLSLGVRDLTGGFKAFRREAAQALPWAAILSDGYAFQIETTFRAIQNGSRVREIPIIFGDRTCGQSKISRRVVWEAFRLVWKLKSSARY